MLEFSHPQSLECRRNFDCASPARWNTAKMWCSVNFPLGCIMDQISQNQPCTTARQESSQKNPVLPKSRHTSAQRSRAHQCWNKNLYRSISREHNMLRDTCREGKLVQMILQSIRSSRCSHQGWAEFQESLVSHLASSSTAAEQSFS